MKGTFTSPTTGTRTKRPCETPGCTGIAHWIVRGSWSDGRRCGNCQVRWRRQGHSRQTPVRKREVAKYVTQVQRVLRFTNQEKLGAYLHKVALHLEDAANSPEAVPFGAVGHRRWKGRAVNEILRVLKDTDAVESGVWVAAIFLMHEKEKHRFLSERAFDFQLVRLWRLQTSTAIGTVYNPKTGKVSGFYRELPPGATEHMALWLKTAYSPFVSRVLLSVNAPPTTLLDEAFAPTRFCASPPCERPLARTKSLKAIYCSARCRNRVKMRRRRERRRTVSRFSLATC